VFDKLKFWKKDEPSLDLEELDKQLGLGKQDDLGLPQEPSTSPEAMMSEPSLKPTPLEQPVEQPTYREIPPQQPTFVQKDIEIVSSKLDALRATLDAMNQRLVNIERMATNEQEKKRRVW